MEKRICRTCGEEKEIEKFKKESRIRKDGTRAYTWKCKKCENRRKYLRRISTPESLAKFKAQIEMRKKRSALADPEKYKLRYRLMSVKRTYGLEKDVYLGMLEAQENKCLICEREEGYRLCVDHCHATGKVRGLICIQCNTGIGQFKDDPELIKRALDYLTRS